MRATLLLLFIAVDAVRCLYFRDIREASPLKGISKEGRNEYLKIYFNKTQTMAQKAKNFEAWARKYKVEKRFHEYVSKYKKLEEERQKKVKDLIYALPEALEKLEKIWNNQDQTSEQRLTAISKLAMENKVSIAESPKTSCANTLSPLIIYNSRSHKHVAAAVGFGRRERGARHMEDSELESATSSLEEKSKSVITP
ncbi:unnamed protein product [Heligmosomoides polygyrus]|uniref:DUF148 domain-containing protein n=1 Tax=Heligmosomoides polygyrus TaxID=6339 RepID=A0A183G7V0_HELPZ|nr:unnamed protein product [Heligmosomoides polygyrus]